MRREELEARIFRFLLDHAHYFQVTKFVKGRWTEFVSWAYPRLSRWIDRYRELGLGFGQCLFPVIRNLAWEFGQREHFHRITERACWEARAEDMAVYSAEAEYGEAGEGSEDETLPADIEYKHVLVLLLKSYQLVSDRFLDRIAGALRIKRERLDGLIAEMKDLRRRNDEYTRILREAIRLQYHRCLAFQKHLEDALPDSVMREKWKARCKRASNHLEMMQKRLAQRMHSPANREVAQVLGLSKTTVDSIIQTLRKKWRVREDGSLWRLKRGEWRKDDKRLRTVSARLWNSRRAQTS
ncbi:MAG: hypothetical protein LBR16_03185 [Treponema sp.]|nr:hypothetical protein [Treponema sp.]